MWKSWPSLHPGPEGVSFRRIGVPVPVGSRPDGQLRAGSDLSGSWRAPCPPPPTFPTQNPLLSWGLCPGQACLRPPNLLAVGPRAGWGKVQPGPRMGWTRLQHWPSHQGGSEAFPDWNDVASWPRLSSLQWETPGQPQGHQTSRQWAPDPDTLAASQAHITVYVIATEPLGESGV